MSARTRTKRAANAARAWHPDADTAYEEHRLEGLEPDNLLAFLALLGLLRALEAVRPDCHPRARWDVERHPWRPVLTLAEPMTQAEVSRAAVEGVDELARLHDATGSAKELKYTLEEFLELRRSAGDAERRVLDALACDAAPRDDGTLWPTPFAFMFGSGHQHFLERFRSVPAQPIPPHGKKETPPTPEAVIGQALFRPWERRHRTDGFRWDPEEDRRYAYRADSPSGKDTTTEHGANRLAAVGLSLLPVIAVVRRRGRRVLTPMTRYSNRGEIEFSWPVWSTAATLPGIISLLRHPQLSADEPDLSAMPQVLGVYRARRISVGKYFNVTRAERVV